MLQLKMCLRLHGETPEEDGDFIRRMEVPLGWPLPQTGHFIDLFDQIQLSAQDIGQPVAEVEFVGWATDLSLVEVLIHCDVENTFWYDRPWRQHLKSTGWLQLDDDGTPIQSAS